jgi:hypothetical protein
MRQKEITNSKDKKGGDRCLLEGVILAWLERLRKNVKNLNLGWPVTLLHKGLKRCRYTKLLYLAEDGYVWWRGRHGNVIVAYFNVQGSPNVCLTSKFYSHITFFILLHFCVSYSIFCIISHVYHEHTRTRKVLSVNKITFGFLCEPGLLSGIALGYGLDDRGFQSRQGLGICLFTTVSRPASEPTQPPI